MASLKAIDVSRYELFPESGGAPRVGALLQVRFEDDGVGYADVHPWPELGDATLETTLDSLRSHSPTPLAARALTLARQDAVARTEARSLFDGLLVPKSHATITNVADLSPRRWTELEALGFDTVKCKVTPETLATFVEVASALPSNVRFRLDANARFSAHQVSKLLRAIERFPGRIDFIEDPTPQGDQWARLDDSGRVTWASDWVPSPDPEVVVLKANAREPLQAMQQSEWFPDRWVVTSALDHPVGQAFAAWEAARAQARYGDWVDTCGLATHLVYQRNPFSDRLLIREARLVVAPGRGIGFDDLWPELRWTSLRSA